MTLLFCSPRDPRSSHDCLRPKKKLGNDAASFAAYAGFFVALLVGPSSRVSPPAAASAATFSATEAAADEPEAPSDWPQFRGPRGAGLSAATHLPSALDPAKNLLWKTASPPGHSSPVLGGGKIFLTAAAGDDLLTLAYDTATGRELWRRSAPRPRREAIDNRNGPAAPSPVFSEERVFVFFGDFGLLAYDLDGREQWRLPLGPFNNLYGIGASPIIAAGRLILAIDQHHDSFLLAVDPATGREVWRTPRAEASSGHSTPTLYVPPGGEPQVIVPGSFLLSAYSVANGERLWWIEGLPFEMKSTAAIDGDLLFIHGYGSPLNEPGQSVDPGNWETFLTEHDADHDNKVAANEAGGGVVSEWLDFVDLDRDGKLDERDWLYFRSALRSRNALYAIRLPDRNQRGNLTSSHVVWRYDQKIPQLPSPVAAHGILFIINDRGIATTFRSASGEVLAQGRIEGAIDSYYSSPVLADGKIFLIARSGIAVVLPADGTLQPLSLNDLDDTVVATPALARGRVFLRTNGALWAFSGETNAQPPSANH